MRRIVVLVATAVLMASCHTVPASGVRGEVWFEGGRAPGTPHLVRGTVVVESEELEVAVIQVPQHGLFEIELAPGPYRLTLESCQPIGGPPHIDIRVPEGGFVDAKLVCSG